MSGALFPDLPPVAGVAVLRTPVLPEWLDHNGHMNVAASLIAFDWACCAFSRLAGIGPDKIESSGHTIFVGQANVAYRREVLHSDHLVIGARVPALAADRKHLLLTMYRLRDGAAPELAAVCDELCVCVAMAGPEAVTLAEAAPGPTGVMPETWKVSGTWPLATALRISASAVRPSISPIPPSTLRSWIESVM